MYENGERPRRPGNVALHPCLSGVVLGVGRGVSDDKRAKAGKRWQKPKVLPRTFLV